MVILLTLVPHAHAQSLSLADQCQMWHAMTDAEDGLVLSLPEDYLSCSGWVTIANGWSDGEVDTIVGTTAMIRLRWAYSYLKYEHIAKVPAFGSFRSRESDLMPGLTGMRGSCAGDTRRKKRHRLLQ